MDDLDEHLLARLRDNARAPVAELARALGLSRTTVQSRLAKLERNGVIAGYAVKLAGAYESGRVHAFIMLTVEPKQAAAVTGHPTVTSFVLFALQASVRKVIEEHQQAKLSAEESTQFVKALLAPAAPNAALRGAFKRYREASA